MKLPSLLSSALIGAVAGARSMTPMAALAAGAAVVAWTVGICRCSSRPAGVHPDDPVPYGMN